MDGVIRIDEIFAPYLSPLELVIRATVVYLILTLVARFGLKRQIGRFSTSDLLVLILLASVAKNALIADSYSIIDGLIVALTIVSWNFVIDWACFHFPGIKKIFRHEPQLIIKNGSLVMDALRRELITQAEVEQRLREKGFSDISKIQEAYIEGDGKLSFIAKGSP